MAKRSWSDSNGPAPPGAADALATPAVVRCRPVSTTSIKDMADIMKPPTPARSNSNRSGTRQGGNRQSITGLMPNDLPIPQISRKIKACAACRKHKVSSTSSQIDTLTDTHFRQIKCLMDESGPPCRRCAERNLGCVLSKSLQTIIDEKSQYAPLVVKLGHFRAWICSHVALTNALADSLKQWSRIWSRYIPLSGRS